MTAIWWLFGGALVVLTIASVTAQVLTRKNGPSDMLSNLTARINAWWVMVAALAIVFLLGQTATVLLFAICAGFALREFMTVTDAGGDDPTAKLLAFALILPVQFGLVLWDWYGMMTVFVPVYVFFLLPLLMALTKGPDDIMARLGALQWGLMLAIFGLSHLPALANLHYEGGPEAFLMIAWLVIVVQISDVAQYCWGKLYGKTKLAPVLSPSKTWEGLIGGVVTATLLGVLLSGLTPYGIGGAALVAAIACAMGAAGGLVLSAIKRDRGVKDWGHLIAGHGGFMDRLDSLLFAAPIVFHITRYFWSTV